MRTTEPRIDDRPEQPYVGIRTSVPMRDLSKGIIPQLLGETFGWLEQRGIAPDGPPFLRFHVINMQGAMDIEIGVPVAQAVQGEGRVAPGAIPSGRYASLVYTGVRNGVAANKALLDWGAQRGLRWDTYDSPDGDGFVARYESFLTDPDETPDPAQWETEVAIRLAAG